MTKPQYKSIRAAAIAKSPEAWSRIIDMLSETHQELQSDTNRFHKVRRAMDLLELRGVWGFIPKWIRNRTITKMDELSEELNTRNKLLTDLQTALGLQPTWVHQERKPTNE